jgi:hypothetical protein
MENKDINRDMLIQGLDLVDVIHFIAKKNKTYLAIMLHDLEEVVDKDSPEFAKIRKIMLDGINEYTRSINRVIFGNDFEDGL